MRIPILLLLLLWQMMGSPSVQAQCLSLDDLLAIGAERTGLTAPQTVASHLSSAWTMNSPVAPSKEVFWTLVDPESDPPVMARLSLRAQRPGQDVVLKTSQVACVRQIRSELKSRKLTAQPVTCPSCEATRFQGPNFEATIYSRMKGDYQFVVVVHQVPIGVVPPPGSAPAVGPGAKAAITPAPTVDIATATKLLADPNATVLDVRTPEEYASGHLQGAQNINFRASNFSQQLSKLNPLGHYVLYCASGNRSGRAAILMQQQGIANVTNAGGYNELKAAGNK